MTQIQNSKQASFFLALALIKLAMTRKKPRRIPLAFPVSVIDYCDLEFICNLVLGI
jgi:hypothetical protein